MFLFIPNLKVVTEEYNIKFVFQSVSPISRVISVSNEKMRLHHIDKQNNNLDGVQFSKELNVGNLHKQWISERSTIIEQYVSLI